MALTGKPDRRWTGSDELTPNGDLGSFALSVLIGSSPLRFGPLFGRAAKLRYNSGMLSARNQLPGTIEEVRIGDIMAHITVRVGDNLVESVITRSSAEALRLTVGDTVRVVVKSTEVMIQKD